MSRTKPEIDFAWVWEKKGEEKEVEGQVKCDSCEEISSGAKEIDRASEIAALSSEMERAEKIFPFHLYSFPLSESSFKWLLQ